MSADARSYSENPLINLGSRFGYGSDVFFRFSESLSEIVLIKPDRKSYTELSLKTSELKRQKNIKIFSFTLWSKKAGC